MSDEIKVETHEVDGKLYISRDDLVSYLANINPEEEEAYIVLHIIKQLINTEKLMRPEQK